MIWNKRVIMMAVFLFVGQSMLLSNSYADTTTYYDSGNLQSVERFGYTYWHRDENYWGTSIPQGRQYRLENSSGWFEEYTFFPNEPSRYASIERSLYGGTAYTTDYYNEAFYENPMLQYDNSGNVAHIYSYYTGSYYKQVIGYFDANGIKQWDLDYIAYEEEIEFDADGNLIVYGYSFLHGGVLAKYTPEKSEVFLTKDSNLPSNTIGMKIDEAGWIYVLLYDFSTPEEFLLVAYNENGVEQWRRNRDCGDGSITFNTLFLNEKGNLCIRGYILSGSQEQSFEVTYSTDGTFLRQDNIHNHSYADRYFNTGRVMQEGDTEYFAYISGTNISLVTYISNLSPDIGGGALFYAFYNEHIRGEAIRMVTENGLIIDSNLLEGMVLEETAQITKLTYPSDLGGNTNWFLWGDNVYGEYDNVVIKKTQAGIWSAYTFPDTSNQAIIMDPSNWVYIGFISDPDMLDLPELGDWTLYCADNSIVPEFPPLSSDYTRDGLDRVIERVDHNPYTDTTYTYDWDFPAPGQVKVGMSYDYDDDGNVDLISTRVYNNGADYDIGNINTWELLSEGRKYYKNGVLKTYVTSLNKSDFNLDGRVDLNDFAILRRNYDTAASATRLIGDANGDGKVNHEDLSVFASQWGNRSLSHSENTMLYDVNGNLVVKIFADDGHREIYVYTDGLFTEDDVLASGILNPEDVIVDRTVAASPEDLQGAPEELVSEASAKQVNPDAVAMLEARQTAQGAAGKRRRSKFRFLNELKGKKARYLDWAKD